MLEVTSTGHMGAATPCVKLGDSMMITLNGLVVLIVSLSYSVN